MKKNNRLIAEFMGYSQAYPNYSNATYWYKKNNPPLTILLYNISWDWLIPCCKKIITEFPGYNNDIYIENIIKAGMSYDINEVYQTVVEFIKWHNKQNLK